MKAGSSLVELALVAVFVSVATYSVLREHNVVYVAELSKLSAPGQEELAPLMARYGDRKYSRNAEELIVRDFYQDRRGGTFLDVGANHYRNESNTYFLETQLGWSGVAVDALPEFAPGYAQHRPRTRFVAAFASDTADGTIPFFVPKDNTLVASSDRGFTVRMKAPGEAREVPTTTLNLVLEQAGIERIDFMSMDIELAEPKALAGFAIDRFRPSLVCIEGHPEVRQQILDYFAAHQYVLAGKYLRMDPFNLYFTPILPRE